jgi:hypothetical protein
VGTCDSITVLNLTVNSIHRDTINASICQASVYSFNGVNLFSSGTYLDTISGVNTCDSIVTLILTVMANINDSATANGSNCVASQNGASYQWVSCSTGQLISGATSQTYAALQDGIYECIVTVGNCSDTTNCLSITTIGISDVTDGTFNLYPNPTSGSFIIEHSDPGQVDIQIHGTIGNLVKQFTMTESIKHFDVSDLANGVYQITISDNGRKIKVLKLIKEY